MKETLKQRLDRIGAEAEAGEADQTARPLPENVTVTRPNRARSKVLQVRLNDSELEALERVAERRGLPVSTVARAQLLELVAADVTDPAVEFEAAADKIQGLVAQMRNSLILLTECADPHGVSTRP